MAEKFLKGAIKHPGRLTNIAKREGETVDQVAKAHEHDSGGLGSAARMYENVLKPINNRHPDAKKASHGDGKGHWSGH